MTRSIAGFLRLTVPAVVAAAALTLPHSARAEKPGALQKAPEWKLKDVDGNAVRLSDFKGKVVILDFWATWCPPCREEIPGFVDLQKKYSKQGLVVVGVSLDQGGPDVVKKFMKDFKITYPIVMGDEATTTAYGGIDGIPTTFVIDKAGNVADQHVGFTEVSEFEAAVKKLLY